MELRLLVVAGEGVECEGRLECGGGELAGARVEFIIYQNW